MILRKYKSCFVIFMLFTKRYKLYSSLNDKSANVLDKFFNINNVINKIKIDTN